MDGHPGLFKVGIVREQNRPDQDNEAGPCTCDVGMNGRGSPQEPG